MSARPSPREAHGQHEDERNRVNALARHERAIREREHLRVVTAIAPPRTPHRFATPIRHRYEAAQVIDHMVAPGEPDDTGFSDGIC